MQKERRNKARGSSSLDSRPTERSNPRFAMTPPDPHDVPRHAAVAGPMSARSRVKVGMALEPVLQAIADSKTPLFFGAVCLQVPTIAPQLVYWALNLLLESGHISISQIGSYLSITAPGLQELNTLSKAGTPGAEPTSDSSR